MPERDWLVRLVEQVGGVALLAIECGVTPRTAQRWVDGVTRPRPASRRRLAFIARDLGVRAPVESDAAFATIREEVTGVRRRGVMK